MNTSDAREKKDIQTSDFGLDFISKLRPVSYHWKKGADTDLHYGLIAQETEKVVSEFKKGKVIDPSNVIVAYDKKTDRYGIKYTELISPVIKAIQELYSEIKALGVKVIALEKNETDKDRAIASLKAENAEIKARLERIEKKLESKK